MAVVVRRCIHVDATPTEKAGAIDVAGQHVALRVELCRTCADDVERQASAIVTAAFADMLRGAATRTAS